MTEVSNGNFEAVAAAALAAVTDVLSRDPDPATIVDGVSVARVGRVAILTLARPDQHNVVALAGWRQINSVLAGVAADPSVRVLVVRGAGTKAFGTGCDIKEFESERMGPSAVSYNEELARGLRALDELPIPVVAMLRGLTVGAGLQIAAACDVRVAAQDLRTGIPVGRLGVVIGMTEANVLVRALGAAELKHLLFSGRLLNADDALRVGLVQQIVPVADLVAATAELVGNIVANAPTTMRTSKILADMVGQTLAAADTEALTRASFDGFCGDDFAEGVSAFLDRRSPEFPSNSRHVGTPS